MKPTKPAIQISDADRKRKILITDKCTMAKVQEMAGKRRVPGLPGSLSRVGTGALTRKVADIK